ncbi:hypothetical protein HII31_05635 [Pseudocercospora fuligena]|uniref:Uncharacterized protein n=1 Tax=Pseudocercospora fuligena TaxID=685502 RepID=A0A8H6RKD3_9PEZI|nr:hypothetical protein HII31_05635 [Pseudocercospora fuligena]
MRSNTSIFTYSLSRPYPSRKVTWIVLGGGITLAVLFSFVAVASNAYQFQSIYTTDPNSTVSHREWYQKAPFSWLSNMDATCQAAILTAGSQYLTTGRGFVYTLDQMRLDATNGSGSGVLSSTAYKNVTLKDCDVVQISINLARADQSRYAKNRWAWGATTAQAITMCTVESDNGPVGLNFTMILPEVESRSGSQITENVLRQSKTAKANMYYGVQIMSAWYGKIAIGMGYSVPGGDPDTDGASWGSGTITLTRNPNVSDYKDSRFFITDVGLSNDHGGLSFMHPPYTIQDWQNQADPDKEFMLPNISISVDTFGKSFYSLLLSDFGVNKSVNAISTPAGLEYLQSINDTELSLAVDDPAAGICPQYFNPDEDKIQALNSTMPMTLFTQYLCSVPKQKGGFSLFFGVILADIVFLNACWTLFGWAATWWFGRRDPHANYCAGCANALSREEMALDDRGSSQAHFSLSNSGSHEYLPVAASGSGDHLSVRSTQPLIHRNDSGA